MYLIKENMVKVFKTDIQCSKRANHILGFLAEVYPNLEINFDLEDCDNILRIEGDSINPDEITNKIEIFGYLCVELH